MSWQGHRYVNDESRNESGGIGPKTAVFTPDFLFESFRPLYFQQNKELKMDKITIQTTVAAPIGKVWTYWTNPKHIVNWSHASEDWHTPFAENDLRVGGNFKSRMEAKDVSFGFDFGGTYDEVERHRRIAYTMSDDRSVQTDFYESDGSIEIIQTFDPETQNPVEMQRDGWQAILDNFRKYVESN